MPQQMKNCTAQQPSGKQKKIVQVGRSEYLSMTKEIHVVQNMRHTHWHGRDDELHPGPVLE